MGFDPVPWNFPILELFLLMHQLELRAIFTTEVADTQNQLEADTLLLISFS